MPQRVLSIAVAAVIALAAAAAHAQAPPPEYAMSLTLEQAKKIVAGAEAEAMKNKWQMVITVLDAGGHTVMVQRLDNAQYGSIDVSRDKAKAAVAFKRPTKAFQDLIAQGGVNLRLLNLTGDAGVLEGGIPIIVGNKVIGAVGVSGGTSQQDHQVAQAGIDALSK